MKFPDEIYVQIEREGDDEFLAATHDAVTFSEVGQTVTAMLYRRVGAVSIKSSLKITKPKK